MSHLSAAWLAGPGYPVVQTFDVWLAFEFAPLVSDAEISGAAKPKPGTYLIRDHGGRYATVKGGDSTDGVAVVAVEPETTVRTGLQLPYSVSLLI